MKELFKKWNSISLVLRIVVGMVIGILLGIFCPGATFLTMLGSLFVGALRAIAPILVFIIVMSSLANAKNSKLGNFRTVVILYMFTTFLGAFVAVVASFLFPSTLVLAEAATSVAPPSGVGEVLSNLLLNVVSNPVESLASANYVGILFWGIVFGIAMKNAHDATKQLLADASAAATYAVQLVISLAPFGIMGLVFNTVSTNGLSVFADYGHLLLVLVGSMLFLSFVTNPLLVFLTLHINPFPIVFTCLKESAITAFFTRSSAANIPVNMALCKKLGLNEDNYSVSIPLGATSNMDGAAVTITVMTLAAAATLGIPVDFASALLLSLLATVSACGASGVAGGSLLLIPLACSLFGIPNEIAMQVVGVGFIIGVIQDSVETALNSSSDVLLTYTAEKINERKAAQKATA